MRWLHALGHALAISGSMTWEILWALILGFALSAMVQAVCDDAGHGGGSRDAAPGRVRWWSTGRRRCTGQRPAGQHESRRALFAVHALRYWLGSHIRALVSGQPALSDGSGNPPRAWGNPDQQGTIRKISLQHRSGIRRFRRASCPFRPVARCHRAGTALLVEHLVMQPGTGSAGRHVPVRAPSPQDVGVHSVLPDVMAARACQAYSVAGEVGVAFQEAVQTADQPQATIDHRTRHVIKQARRADSGATSRAAAAVTFGRRASTITRNSCRRNPWPAGRVEVTGLNALA